MLHKSGGVWFWKLGRFGGSFYRRKATWQDRLHPRYTMATLAVDVLAVGTGFAVVYFILGEWT